MLGMGELLLIRHGETPWSRTGQYGGRTDLPLSAAGVAAGGALGPMLAGRPVAAAFSSPLSRAVRTAELAGLADAKPDPDLLEWDYGAYEGCTEEQIRETRPGWDLWRDGVAGGETLKQVASRADAVLDRVRPLLRDGDVAIIGHGHLQRVLAVRWLGLEPSAARMLSHPHTGTISALAYEHEQPVVSAWNVLA
jgi:broad specificity phosphatase PhoE